MVATNQPDEVCGHEPSVLEYETKILYFVNDSQIKLCKIITIKIKTIKIFLGNYPLYVDKHSFIDFSNAIFAASCISCGVQDFSLSPSVPLII